MARPPRHLLLLRAWVEAADAAAAAVVQARLVQALQGWGARLREPAQVTRDPACREIVFDFPEAGVALRERLLAASGPGDWHRSGDDHDFSAVWDRRRAAAGLFDPALCWAELIHSVREDSDAGA